MNYYKIGQQIRKYRQAHGLSQESLADLPESCTAQQLRVITDIAKTVKTALEKHIN